MKQEEATHSYRKTDDEEEEEQSVEPCPVDRELVLPCRCVAGRHCNVYLEGRGGEGEDAVSVTAVVLGSVRSTLCSAPRCGRSRRPCSG